LQLRTQIGHGSLHGLGIGHKVRRAGRQMGGENRHGKPQSEEATLVDVDVNVNLTQLAPTPATGFHFKKIE
jgi:hypothetical protein